MRYGIVGLAVGLAALAVLGAVGSSVEAQTASAGPYYAMPSWDQTLPAATRFIILSNMNAAAVLDRETGLVWERSPLSPCTNVLFCATIETGKRLYVEALLHCVQLTTGHRGGWRLPTVQELMSLVDFDPANTSAVRLPPGHPFVGPQPMSYWSGSDAFDVSGVDDPTVAYTVNLDGGDLGVIAKAGNFQTGNQLGVWCVRGGSAVHSR
jgi:Protein of unknown function (DUF1566)